jgi:hypothetical protein
VNVSSWEGFNMVVARFRTLKLMLFRRSIWMSTLSSERLDGDTPAGLLGVFDSSLSICNSAAPCCSGNAFSRPSFALVIMSIFVAKPACEMADSERAEEETAPRRPALHLRKEGLQSWRLQPASREVQRTLAIDQSPGSPVFGPHLRRFQNGPRLHAGFCFQRIAGAKHRDPGTSGSRWLHQVTAEFVTIPIQMSLPQRVRLRPVPSIAGETPVATWEWT